MVQAITLIPLVIEAFRGIGNILESVKSSNAGKLVVTFNARMDALIDGLMSV